MTTATLEEIGRIDRPEMGDQVPLLIFRAFRQFAQGYVDDVLGRGSAVVFQNGGRELGKTIGGSLMDPDLGVYLGRITEFVADQKIGKLRLVSQDEATLVLALDECITCAGMESIGRRICHFEVGLVAGVVEAFVGRKVRAHETKCNANGEDTCEVTVSLA